MDLDCMWAQFPWTQRLTRMGEALHAVHLCKNYGKTHVLNGFVLEVAEGTVYGLTGPNVSGKTTTIKIHSRGRTNARNHVRLFMSENLARPSKIGNPNPRHSSCFGNG